MDGSINLLPRKTRQEIQEDLHKYFLDVISAGIVLIAVIAAFTLINIDSVKAQQAHDLQQKVTTNEGKLNGATYKGITKDVLTLHLLLASYTNIEKGSLDQEGIIESLEKLTPPTVTLSDYIFDGKNVNVTASSGSELEVAKMLVNLSPGNKSNTLFRNVQIAEVDQDAGTNQVTFKLTALYVRQ